MKPRNEPSDGKIRLLVQGLSKDENLSKTSDVETIELERSDYLYKGIQLLRSRVEIPLCLKRRLIESLLRLSKFMWFPTRGETDKSGHLN